MNKNAAEFFYGQCTSKTNPVMLSVSQILTTPYSAIIVDGISKAQFARMLTYIADQLELDSTDDPLALFFYEQCTGVDGDNNPFHPILYGLISSYCTANNIGPAHSKTNFITMLRDFTGQLGGL